MTLSPSENTPPTLTERQEKILRSVVDSFVRTGSPVGSRTLAKRYDLGLSPASIRNTMSDLEEMGYLGHPHTSAGRMPTEAGYRVYVDNLVAVQNLTPHEQDMVMAELSRVIRDSHELWRESSRLLGHLSDLLGVVLTPKLSKGVFHRLDVVPLSSTRAMFVISIRSGLVKTIVLEVEFDVREGRLNRMVSILNERLSGLTLEEIRITFADRLRDLREDPSGLVGVVLKNADVLFDELPEARRLQYSGTQNIIVQPEFQDPGEMQNIIALLENEGLVVRLLEQPSGLHRKGEVSVSIGAENKPAQAARYSIVTAEYTFGNATGTIGVIGPTRMDYARTIALVKYMRGLLNRNADESQDLGIVFES